MNNVCEKLEMEYSIKEKQPTFKDMLMELNKLRLENEILKADKEELQKENIQLKKDVQILHNKLNVEENDNPSLLHEYEEYLCGCETKENLKAMAEAYAEFV